MHILIDRDLLYKGLQKIINVINNRPRLPILTHILLEIEKNYVFITATNLEIEISMKILLNTTCLTSSITVPGKKFFEICRYLPKCSKISIKLKNTQMFINSGDSNFSLSTISAKNFPKIKKWEEKPDIIVSQSILKKMIDLTQFSMAYQDARYYLNGMLFQTKKNTIRMVSSDGYRLSMTEKVINSLLPEKSIIIPRKGILELSNLLNFTQNMANIRICNNYFCAEIDNYIYNSKLIDSLFPAYFNMFPKKPKHIFEIDRIILKQSLKRVSILSNSKLRSINFYLTHNQLKINTSNFDQETAEENLEISYANESIQVSLNVDYLLDIINVIDTKLVKIFITDQISSIKIEGVSENVESTYIIMPIRI